MKRARKVNLVDLKNVVKIFDNFLKILHPPLEKILDPPLELAMYSNGLHRLYYF